MTAPAMTRGDMMAAAAQLRSALRARVQRDVLSERLTPEGVASYAALHLTTDSGMPLVPAAHHRLWLEVLCDESIDKLLIIAPPESAKPVSVDALVLMADGSRKRLGDVSKGERVITHTRQAQRVLAVHDQGIQPLLRITTYSGRVIDAAPDHPFLTAGGWVNAGDLQNGMALAVLPRANTEPTENERSLEEYRLAGYFIGDGCTTYAKNYGLHAIIACIDPIEEADIRHCADTLGFGMTAERKANSYGLSGGVREWLRQTELAGKNAHTKRVPDWIFRSSPQQIAHFLGAYIACDGYINPSWKGRANPQVDISSVSLGLLQDVQSLMGRIGVDTKIRHGHVNYNKRKVDYYRLTTNSREAVVILSEQAPIYHAKATSLNSWTLLRTKFAGPFIDDPVVSVLPIEPGLCRCLTVEHDGTFIAGDVVVKNTSWTLSAFTGAYIGCFPERSVLIASSSGPIAEKRSISLRNAILTRAWRRTYPTLAPALGLPWKTTQWSIAPNGQPHSGRLHPTLSAYGTGGSVVGSRADLIVADDLLDSLNTSTSYQREGVKMWFHTTLYSRLKSRTGRIVVIGTAWHASDLYADLRRQGSWVVVHTRLLSDEGQPQIAYIQYPDGWPGRKLGVSAAGPPLFLGNLATLAVPQE
jgi:intein/homing endonuclease